ncbi:MAG TPA: hypothetical protein VM597_22080 [Gemmataceae bacterium]|nr:hypothetical protein [Gemmataceae bacterium]
MPETPEPNDLAYFNGIDGSTGRYLLPPMSATTLAAIARGETWGGGLSDLKLVAQRRQVGDYRIVPGRDETSLASAGWGLITPAKADPKLIDGILDALKPLRDLRKEQAGPLYKEFVGPGAGYRLGESKAAFLARPKLSDADRAGAGPVDPNRVPYYLLIIADPESIPFEFQYQLDVQYAVGRICFRTLNEYASYAATVVAAETGKGVARRRKAVFFNVANPDDRATALSSRYLIPPLAAKMAEADAGNAPRPAWEAETVAPKDATKKRLGQLLGGAETPAFLFTASHGMGFPEGDVNQLPFQGALLCQDWPGPYGGAGPISRDHYFGAEDVLDAASPAGMIAFFFACYGGGTPKYDDFAKQAFGARTAIAPRAFTAALPMRLLGHPKGGALAVVGHIERAWGYSIRDNGVDQIEAFRSALHQLKRGYPVGAALEDMNGKYAELAAELSQELGEAEYKPVPPERLAGLWTANNDARGYAVFGDPAVRAAVADQAPAAPPAPVEFAARSAAPLPAVFAPEAAPPAAPPGEGAVPMALPGADTLRGIKDSLATALKQFADRVTAMVSDLTSVEVATFTADNMDQVTYDSAAAKFTGGARQRALTRISLDGDTHVCVPQVNGQTDKALWEIHLSTVREAQAHRAAMLKAVADVLGGWVQTGAGG